MVSEVGAAIPARYLDPPGDELYRLAMRMLFRHLFA